jgi:hypothetical protein
MLALYDRRERTQSACTARRELSDLIVQVWENTGLGRTSALP